MSFFSFYFHFFSNLPVQNEPMTLLSNPKRKRRYKKSLLARKKIGAFCAKIDLMDIYVLSQLLVCPYVILD